MRIASVSRDTSAIIKFSLPFSEDSTKEISQYSWSDAPVNIEAPATIEISLPPSKSSTRDMLQWTELFPAKDEMLLPYKWENWRENTWKKMQEWHKHM